MQLMNEDSRQVTINACVYGHTGSGKSTLGASAPGALILLSEHQAQASIRTAMTRTGNRPQVLLMGSIKDYQAMAKALAAGPDELGKFEVSGMTLDYPETVVVDSVTDVFDWIVADVNGKGKLPTDKFGLPKPSIGHWGAYKERMIGFLKAFRDIPCNTLFLALAKTAGEGDEKHTFPNVGMKDLANAMGAVVNLVGYQYTRYTEHGIQYATAFQGGERCQTKGIEPLRKMEPSDFGAWVQAIRENVSIDTKEPVETNEVRHWSVASEQQATK